MTGRRRGRDLVSTTQGKLHPAEVFRALQPYLDRDPDSVLICDGGEFAQWGQSMLRNDRRMINGVAGSIGSSLPMAPARGWSKSRAPVFAVLGDGTFGFHMSEIETAVRLNLPYVAIVGTDCAVERRIQPAGPRLRPEPHAWLRAESDPLRPCGHRAGRPWRTGDATPPTCRARSSARWPAASRP